MTARPEALLERHVLLALGAQPDVWLARNEVGQGFHGALASQLCPDCRAASQRHRLTHGLGTGSPDLVGTVGGIFVGLELKSATGRVRPEQTAWHAAAAKRGVLVEVVRSVEEAVALVDRARSGR